MTRERKTPEKKMNFIQLHPYLESAYVERFGKAQLDKNLAYSNRYIHDFTRQTHAWQAWQIYPNVLQAFTIMCLAMIQNKGLKGAHPPLSIVASGSFTLTDKTMIRFGSAQKTFPLLLRHTYNLHLAHPLEKGVRSVALEIGNFFHPTFLSAECAPFFNMETFMAFGKAMQALKQGDNVTFLSLFQEHPCLWNAICASLSPTPLHPSYLDLHYFSMMTYDLQEGKDTFLVRFRVRPFDKKGKPVPSPQMTLQDVENFMKPGAFYFTSDVKKPTDLYEVDYAAHLKRKKFLRYEMDYQCQSLPQDPIQEGWARNASVAWDAKQHPYTRFGSFQISTLHKDDNSSAFDVRRMPKHLSLAPATSILDPRIIGEVRSFIYPRIQQIRLASQSLWNLCR